MHTLLSHCSPHSRPPLSILPPLPPTWSQGIWGPFLVIAPLSTLGHWQREIEGWTHLNCVVYHGSKEARQNIWQYEWHFDRRGPPPFHFSRGGTWHALLTILLLVPRGRYEWHFDHKGPPQHKVSMPSPPHFP